jgi:hypothetical protein
MTPGANTDSPAQLAAVEVLHRLWLASQVEAAESGALDGDREAGPAKGPAAGALAAACCLGTKEKNCKPTRPCGTEGELERLEAHPATLAWREARSARFAARSERPGDWYDQRAQGELRSLLGRGRACGRVVTVSLSCTACGLMHDRHYRCGIRQACDACAAAYYRRTRRRLVRATGRAAGQQYERWRQHGCRRVRPGVDGTGKPALRMLTLTVRHDGDPAVDRDRIALGWVRLRAWVHARLGYSPPFALAWQMTKGEDGGAGHVHAHVVTWWPWLDWAALSKEWTRATDGHGQNIDTGARSERAQRARKHSRPAEQAAYYVSMYASKDELAALFEDVDTLAAWYRATRGRRLVSTSRGWWVDEPARTPCCKAPFHLESARGTAYAVTHADAHSAGPCNPRDGPPSDARP